MLKTAKFNIYLEKSEKMSYSKNTKTIKNFNRVDEQKEIHHHTDSTDPSRLRRTCAEALTKKEDLL